MSSSIKSLKKLDLVTLKNIESSIVSIYKINKDHGLFKPILEAYPILTNAEYVIYPNINNSHSKIFLDSDGEELLTYDNGLSEFILLPSDLYSTFSEIEIDEGSLEFNTTSNYHWQ